jgi:tetraacyldisaccharide 4'-kinase
VAAIGNPQRFFQLLERAGINVIAHPFPDHHKFLLEELDFADELAVLMTEKDAVKCSTWARENFWYLPVDAQLDPEIVRQLVAKVKAVRKGELARERGSQRSARLINPLT